MRVRHSSLLAGGQAVGQPFLSSFESGSLPGMAFSHKNSAPDRFSNHLN